MDAVPERILVCMELRRVTDRQLVMAGRSDHREDGILIVIVHQMGEHLGREVGVEEALDLLKGVEHELGVGFDLRLRLGGKGVHIKALVAHTGDVRVQTVVDTGSNKGKRLLPFQRDRRTLHILLTEGGNIILKGDGNAADQVVHDRDGVHAEGKISINRRAEKQTGHSGDGVLAAVLLPGAEAMGKGDLKRGIAADQAVDREPGHVAEGVAVDLDRDHGFLIMIEDEQEQEVRHAVVIEGLDLARLLVFHHIIRTDEEDALKAALHRVNLALIIDKACIEGVGVVLAGDVRLLQLSKDDGNHKEEQHDEVHDQDNAFGTRIFQHKRLPLVSKNPRVNRGLRF